MCKQKGNSFCCELGEDLGAWSRETPLAKPEWILTSIDFLVDAFNFVLEGSIKEAKLALRGGMREEIHDSVGLLDKKLNTWFDVHAQNTGTWRRKAFLRSIPDPLLPLDPVKSFTKYAVPLFTRDNFHCRYCGSKVVPKKIFRKMNTSLGENTFPLGRTNRTCSGYHLMFCATLDHVIPHSLGGRTNETNLVTCCWSCNYGKSNYTLEQLGLDNPFDRAPIEDRAWKLIFQTF